MMALSALMWLRVDQTRSTCDLRFIPPWRRSGCAHPASLTVHRASFPRTSSSVRKNSPAMRCLILSALLSCFVFAGHAAAATQQVPTLAIGSPLPEFTLPGIDGRDYTPADF